MAPKNEKTKKKTTIVKKVSSVSVEPEVSFKIDEIDVPEMDLVHDLNEEFFADAGRLVQWLMQTSNQFAAIKLKYFIDILVRLHAKYLLEAENNKEMVDKMREADEKLRAALETTATSNEMFAHLRDSLEDAWRAADAGWQREAVLKEQVEQICISEYSYRRDLHDDDTTGVKTPESRMRYAVYRERDRLNLETKELEKRLDTQRYYSLALEDMIESYKATATKQAMRISLLDMDNSKLEEKIHTMKEKFDEKYTTLESELGAAKETIFNCEKFKHQAHKTLREFEQIKALNEHLLHDHANNAKLLMRAEEDKNNLLSYQISLENRINTLAHNNQEAEAEIKRLDAEIKRGASKHIVCKRKLLTAGTKIADLEQKVQTLKNVEITLLKKTQNITSQLENMIRSRDEVMRMRDRSELNVIRLNDAIAGLKHDLAMLRNENQQVRMDMDRLLHKLEESKIMFERVIKEKNHLINENCELHDKNQNLTDNLALKTERVDTLTEQLRSQYASYMQVKKQMETIHSEKVMLQKNLDLITRDRNNLQNLNAKLNYQVLQLTTEVAANEKEINSTKIRIEHLNNEIKSKISEIHGVERLLHNKRNDIKELKVHLDQSQRTIRKDEQRMLKLSRELEELRKIKNLVGLQMVRRNDEMVLLRDKLNITKCAMDRGRMQYNQRIEDIRLLKLEIQNLRMSNDCLQRAALSTSNMRNEVWRVERLLYFERQRVTALTEDMRRPVGIHRWRILKGKDPQKYELISKIQVLLKRNVKLNHEKANVQTQYKHLAQMYAELTEKVKLYPDASLKQKLLEEQRIKRQQQRKLKAMKAELAVNEIDLKAREALIDGYQIALKKAHLMGKIPISATSVNEVSRTDISSDIESRCVDNPFSFSSECSDGARRYFDIIRSLK